MYGTIARVRVKPGMLEAFEAWQEANEVKRPEGPGAMLVFQLDRNPDELMVVIASESEAAYREFSERPGMHERYLDMLQFLDGEPEWYDGAIINSRFDL